MTIREIELDNFRIYKGKNRIELFPDGNKNLIIVSGNNGFGKTTFLMSLVWCLYGKNMGKVDELYRKEIDEGGNLAASKIRNLECPNYEICLIDYGCGKFNRKIHIMEQYP